MIIALVSSYIAVDSHYAKAAEVEKLELRLDQKIIMDRQDRIQERIWKYQDRYPKIEEAPPTVKEEYRLLIVEHDKLKVEANQINKTMEKLQ